MLQWTIKISFSLMVCSRTQGMTATLEDRGVCVCLKEEEKKSQRYNVWQSQPSTAPDTVEEHPDGHRPKWCEYWSTLLETGRAGGTISFLLHLGFVRWKGKPIWTLLLRAGAFLDDNTFWWIMIHSGCSPLNSPEMSSGLLWASTALVLMSAEV